MTNKNKHIKTIGSALIVGTFLFLAFGSDDSKSDKSSKETETNKTIDCSASKDAYSSGYSAGSLCKVMGDPSSCESYVNSYNYETGRNILVASDCYCEGFNDGKSGVAEKYK
jgi:hypothetical protein